MALRTLLVPALWLFAGSALGGPRATVHAIQILGNDDCILDQTTTVPCSNVGNALRRAHASRTSFFFLDVHGAKHDAVILTRDTLRNSGFHRITLIPPIEGTVPSDSVRHWMRIAVWCSQINHPLPMTLISTERFETWREHLIVLSRTYYEIVAGRIADAMDKPECSSLPHEWEKNPYDCVLSVENHADEDSRSCTIEKKDSVELVSSLIDIPHINWSYLDTLALQQTLAEFQFGGPSPVPSGAESN